MSETLITDSLRCPHGLGTPAACVDCMDEGRFVPRNARRVGSSGHGIAGYAFDRDCTVQAICEATAADYDEATTALRSAGWVPGKGASSDQVASAIRSLGLDVRAPGLGSIVACQRASETGRTFILSGQIGRKRHAWAVVNGVHVGAGKYLARGTNLRAIEIVV